MVAPYIPTGICKGYQVLKNVACPDMAVWLETFLDFFQPKPQCEDIAVSS